VFGTQYALPGRQYREALQKATTIIIMDAKGEGGIL